MKHLLVTHLRCTSLCKQFALVCRFLTFSVQMEPCCVFKYIFDQPIYVIQLIGIFRSMGCDVRLNLQQPIRSKSVCQVTMTRQSCD